MTGQDRQRIRIGRIATAHGVRGLVKVLVMADDRALFESTLIYKDKNGDEPLSLALKNPVGKYWVAEVEGVHDRDAALALAHTDLWIDRAALPAPADGEYYTADLIGLNAMNEQGATVGTIIAVHDFGATPLLEIKPEGKTSFYIPFTEDTVREEHPKDGYIVVTL